MKKKRTYLIAYVVISLLLLANLIVDGLYQISIAGYWSDRLLFWIWFFGTLATIVTFWKKLLTKIYVGLLIVGLILSILPMMVPFFAIVLSTTGQGLRFKKQLSPQYRLQVINYGIMARPTVEIIVNKGLLEKRIARYNGSADVNDSIGFEVWEIKDVKLISEDEKKISVMCYHGQLNGVINFEKNKR